MRKLFPVATACVLVLACFALVQAGSSPTVRDIKSFPLVTTAPNQAYVADCDGLVITDLIFYPGIGARTYTAKFTAMHGGTLRLWVGNEITSLVVPPDEIGRDYSMSVTVKWQDAIALEAKFEAQTTPGHCPGPQLRVWDYNLLVSP